MTGPAVQPVETLVHEYQGLACGLARRYRHLDTLEDLEQVALEGLVKAAQRFDPVRGKPFPAFAAPYILGALRHHVRDCTTAQRQKTGGVERLVWADTTSLDTPVTDDLTVGDLLSTVEPGYGQVEDRMMAGWLLGQVPAHARQATVLYAQGVAMESVGVRVGVSHMTVSRWLRHAQQTIPALAF